jgi:hypothetical protein
LIQLSSNRRKSTFPDTNGQKDSNNQSLVARLMAVPLRLPWPNVVSDALKVLPKAIQVRSSRFLYEVLE